MYGQQAGKRAWDGWGGWASGVHTIDGICLRCRRRRKCEFDPWVGKIPMEEGVTTHSSILARKTPWSEEPGGLQSTGL